MDDRLVQARRARILAAARMLLREDPHADLRLAAICARARVSRRTVCESFDGRAALVLALFDDLVARVGATMADARRRRASSWLDGVRAALDALLDLLDASPGVARFLIVDSLAGDDVLLERRGCALATVASELDSGAPSPPAGSTPAPFGAEALVGAVVSILHARLLEDPVPALWPLRGSMMSVIVLPYLGVEASRRELERLAPASRKARRVEQGGARRPAEVGSRSWTHRV
jgi:AcrR family transcriptional regulator